MENDILKSFDIQKELNPKVWENGDKPKMKPEIRKRLLEIANEYLEFLDVDIVITDIVLTGSLANYNWSKYSDFDLHIVANFNQYQQNQVELYEKFFNLKKMIFKDKHDIKIKNYDVELYVENESEEHFSSGVYSILFNEWALEPKKENIKIDKKLLKDRSRQWMKTIDELLDSLKDENVQMAKRMLDKYKDKIKKFRSAGLGKNGEYSTENLVFKILRRNGYIEKLYKKGNEIIDKKLSMDQ